MDANEVRQLQDKLTQGAFFSDDRPRTRALVDTVIEKISQRLKEKDADCLYSLQVCAPSPENLAVIIPGQKGPSVWLAPSLENVHLETAEHHIANSLASGIVLTNGTTREEATDEVRNLMLSWNYQPSLNLETTGRSEREGAAA